MITAKSGLIIKNLFHGDNLKAKCARSSVILAVGAFVAKFLGFGSKVILTRLLVPEAMGLMVLILSMTALFEVLSEVGIKQSVIHNKNGSQEDYLNMAWWFQSVRGVGLYLIAFIVSPWICRFYFDKPELLALHSQREIITMVRVVFLVFLFRGLLSPRAFILEKEFRFGKAVFLTQGGNILGSIVTIILAFVMKNIWAMIIGFTSMALIQCAMSYIICPFRPRLSFDSDSLRELTRFAKGMLGLPVLTYIAFHIDLLVAGKLISPDLLGMYGMALALAVVPVELFSKIISPVLLPAFAEKQNDKQALCRAVLKITEFILLLGIPLAALMIIFSKDILSFVYGSQYGDVSVAFSLLCIYTIIYITATVVGLVFFGIGQPGKHRAFVALRAVILIILIYPAVKLFDVTGAAGLKLLAIFLALALQILVIHNLIGLNIFDYLKCWIKGIVLSLPLLILVVLVKTVKPDLAVLHWLTAAIAVLISGVIGLYYYRKDLMAGS